VNDEVEYIIHRVDDVTEHVLTERSHRDRQDQLEREVHERTAELRTSEERFRHLVEGTKDYAIFMLDPQGSVVSWNLGAERITGYREAEILGQHFSRFYLEEDIRLGKPEHEIKVASAEGRFEDEGYRLRKDGSKFWANVVVSALRDETGNLQGFSKTTRDITERKQAEENSRRLLEEATARKGAEENAEIVRQQEDQLRVTMQALNQSQKMEAVGQLAGGIAHDFNNLLTVILGYSKTLLKTLGPADPLSKPVIAINKAGERAADLTRQLLAFSRQTVLEPKVLELNDVVRDTEELLRRLIGEDILLTAVLDPSISRVKVDPSELGQVLMNLAINARDSMPKGGKLTNETRNVLLDQQYASIHPDAHPGPYVMLAITDTGGGMTPEVKSRIFEPFFTTKGVGKGTGLGLSVVHGIIRQSGGFVEVYSELGTGTCFKIYFPAVDEIVSKPTEPDSEETLCGTETVLLVEDEDGVRMLASLVLESYGYKVLNASNGAEAIRLTEQYRDPIDLLMTDVVMPGMGGRELAESLRPRFPKMKMMFSSGYTNDAVVRHGLSHENIAFLQKPYDPTGLVGKVRQVLDTK